MPYVCVYLRPRIYYKTQLQETASNGLNTYMSFNRRSNKKENGEEIYKIYLSFYLPISTFIGCNTKDTSQYKKTF